jgi:hypothetical protein
MRTSRPVVPPSIQELTKRRDDAKEALDQAQTDLDAAVKAEKDEAEEAERVVRNADQKRLDGLVAEQNMRAEEIAALQAKLKQAAPAARVAADGRWGRLRRIWVLGGARFPGARPPREEACPGRESALPAAHERVAFAP